MLSPRPARACHTNSDILLGLDPNFVEDPKLRLDYDPAFLQSQVAAAKDSIVSDTAIGMSQANDEHLPLPEDGNPPHPPLPDDDMDMSMTSSGSLKRKSDTSDSVNEPKQKKRRLDQRLDLEKLNFTKDAKGAVGCCFCLASFDSYPALEFHLCKYHNQPMPTERVRTAAPKKPTSKTSFMCLFCDKTTATASGRRKHMKNVHGYQKKNEAAGTHSVSTFGGILSSDSS